MCLLVCDGLEGLPDAVSAVWETTIGQTCIVRLLRNSFKYASKRGWAEAAKGSSPSTPRRPEADALDRFAEFSGEWEKRYPAIIRLWEDPWAEFVPFLQFGDRDGHLHHQRDRVGRRPAAPPPCEPAATSPPSRLPSRASTWRS